MRLEKVLIDNPHTVDKSIKSLLTEVNMKRYISQYGMTREQQIKWALGEPSLEEVGENRAAERLLLKVFAGLGALVAVPIFAALYDDYKHSATPAVPIVEATQSAKPKLRSEYKTPLPSAQRSPN